MFELFKAYNDHKDLIHAYYAGKSIEGFNNDTRISIETSKILGLEIGVFVVVCIIAIIIWFVALATLIYYQNTMPVWAIVISWLCLLTGFGGPIITLILVFVTKNTVEYRSLLQSVRELETTKPAGTTGTTETTTGTIKKNI